jgi:hypothetical protein
MAEIFVPLETSWFDKEPEKYLSRDDFIAFQTTSKVDFRDLLSKNENIVKNAQEKLVSQTKLLNEVRREYFGYLMPFFCYTHDLNFGKKISSPNPELEKLIFSFDCIDATRRRHVALSHAIIPQAINSLYKKFGRPITISNLCSATGLDTINAVLHTNGKVAKVWNWDIDKDSLELGKQITEYLEKNKKIVPEIVSFRHKPMAECTDKSDIVLLIGAICGLTDEYASDLINRVGEQIEMGGKLIISSANYRYKENDPLGCFLVEHIGTSIDPFQGWALNYRTRESMYNILSKARFKHIAIYDDSNYPGIENLDENILYGIDTLPTEAMGRHPSYGPIALPSREQLNKRIGYNWLAVITK